MPIIATRMSLFAPIGFANGAAAHRRLGVANAIPPATLLPMKALRVIEFIESLPCTDALFIYRDFPQE
jgi:hypothetical protein